MRIMIFFITACFIRPGFAADNEIARVDSINAIPYKYIVSHTKESVKIFLKNINKARLLHYEYGEASALDKLSLAEQFRGNYDKATDAALKAIRIYEKLHALKELSALYGEYGYQNRKRDLPLAIKYMRMGINLAEKNHFTKALAPLYDNYGILIETTGKKDSALYYYTKSLELKYVLKDSIGIPYSLNKILGIYAETGNYEKARQYLKESDKIRTSLRDKYGIAENLVIHGELNMMMKQFEPAILYFKRAIKKGKKLGYPYLIQYCYQQLSVAYEKLKKPDLALDSFKKYSVYKDSLVNEKTNTKISELQITYETEKKDQIIKQNKLELQNKSLQLIILVGLVVIILGVLFFSFVFYKQRQNRLKKELEIRNRLKHAALEKKISDEKLHISRELHDNIGSNLTFIISSIDNLEYEVKNTALLDRLKKLSSLGRETIDDLRNSIWAIKKESGSAEQLVLKINELKQKINSGIERPEILVISHLEAPVELSSTQMLNFYRLVQEAVQNAIKYADANQIKITFSQQEHRLAITIEDDGKGFDLSAASRGNGLINMRARCEESGCRFRIDTSPKGTVVKMTMN